MLVIHVARKPIPPGGTVARTVMTQQAGGLNIDACRIRMQGGEQVVAGLADPAKRLGSVGFGSGFSKINKDKFQAAQIASIDRANKLGRWPANVILEHLPGCHVSGTREVHCNNAVLKNTTEEGFNFCNVGPALKRLPHGEYGHGGADHKETIEDWDCVPGCPVAELDRQSGVTVSRGSGYNWEEGSQDHPVRINKSIKSGQHFSDMGGAARYFKQVAQGDEDK